ncbi:MAG: hypothetical protein QOD06_2760, partial [Candidatus Binatota bacterium]|nr:hypothetical protein [Candidatus Binatota bacterium]
RANERLAREYLAWNLVDHDGTETMLRDVSRLPAAHLLRVRPGERPSIERYWDVKFSDRLDTAPSDREQTIAQFRSLLEETVALHLRSDVPVGSSLSGGLDSSAIVCLASRELQRRNAWREDWQHTFTACFDDPALDERQYAELVARRAGCHPHFVWPRGERLREDLERWVWHQEEPVGGAGVYSQYCVARLASETGVKVLLDGQGADEQLAGYRKFGVVHVRDLLRRGRYGNALAAAAGLLGRELLQPKILDDAWRYLGGTTAGVSQLWPRGDMPERPAAFLLRGSLAERLEQDLRRFSLPALLRYEDRNSMAFGIEARVPFVDHVVVESIAALAADMKIRNGWTKRILRDALVRVVPDEIRLRKRKVYFDAPEAAWLRGPLSEWLADTLQETRHLPQIVDAGAVRHLHLRFTSSRREDSLAALLFRLGMYEAWARRFLEDGASVRLDCPAIAPNL